MNASILADTGDHFPGTVDAEFVRRHQLETLELNEPELVICGGKSNWATQATEVLFNMAGHYEKLWLLVTPHDGHFDLMLGMPWLLLHKPSICLESRALTFRSEFCQSNCNEPGESTTIYVQGVTAKHWPSNIRPKTCSILDDTLLEPLLPECGECDVGALAAAENAQQLTELAVEPVREAEVLAACPGYQQPTPETIGLSPLATSTPLLYLNLFSGLRSTISLREYLKFAR